MELIKQATVWLATGAEAVGAAVIGLAVLEGGLRLAGLFLAALTGRAGPQDARQRAKEDVRLHLGRWLAVALEFELGADILRTAVAPTWSEIGQLAAIAAVRTALNFFLQREIDQAAERRAAAEKESG